MPPRPCRKKRANTLDQYCKVVDLCADLGGSTVIYVAGWQIFGTSRQQAWEWSRQALEKIADHAASRGVTIVIEPTSADSNLVDSCDDALQMKREVDRANVKLMFDTYHVIYRNEVSIDYIDRMGADLHHVHLADANRAGPSDAGKADYRGVIQALNRQNFRGYLTDGNRLRPPQRRARPYRAGSLLLYQGPDRRCGCQGARGAVGYAVSLRS